MPTIFSIRKSEVEGQEDTIVETGLESTFKMSDIQEHMLKLEKAKKELIAQCKFEEAKMVNVLEHNKDLIHSMTDEQMVAVEIYHKAKTTFDKMSEALGTVLGQINKYTEEVEEINRQTGSQFVLAHLADEVQATVPEAALEAEQVSVEEDVDDGRDCS